MRKLLKRYRILALFLVLLMCPAPSWAATGDMPVMIAKAFAFAAQDAAQVKMPLPELKVFLWKTLGERPLCTAEMLPADYGQDFEKDKVTLGKIAVGDPELRACHEMFWAGVNIVAFRGAGVPDSYREALTQTILAGLIREEVYHKGHTFFSGMAWGLETVKGQRRASFTGPPQIQFEEPLSAYVIDPVRIPSGVYGGHMLPMVIPRECINVTYNYGEEAESSVVLPPPPPPPPPTMAEVKIKKEWKRANGKKADTPTVDGDGLQVWFHITPQGGGEELRVPASDNKEAKVELEAGKTYVISEYLNSDRWRSTRDSVTFTVNERKNEEIKFENIEVLAEEPVPTAATGAMCIDCPPGPPGRDGLDGRDGRDGKGVPKWIKWGLPIAGAIAGAALFLPRGNEGGTTNVFSEPCKGSCSTNPGGR